MIVSCKFIKFIIQEQYEQIDFEYITIFLNFLKFRWRLCIGFDYNNTRQAKVHVKQQQTDNIIGMDQIFNEPIVRHFFKAISENDKKSTLKELVLLGIHAVSSKVHQSNCRCCNNHCGCCNCVKVNRNWQAQPSNTGSYCAKQTAHFNNNNNVALQLQQIRNRIDQLSSNYQQPNPQHFQANIQSGTTNKNQEYAPKQAQEVYQNDSEAANANRKQFRHHLDDSQVRKALVNPYAKISPPKYDKKKKSLQKNHLLQKERDAQVIKNNRDKVQITQNNYEADDNAYIGSSTVKNSKKLNVERESNKKLIRTALGTVTQQYNRQYSDRKQGKNKSYGQTKSKIKSLIEKDRQRNKKITNHKKQQYSKSKYCQFEYSDESSYEEESNHNQATQQDCPVHSRKKQIEELSEEDSSLQVQSNDNGKAYQVEQRKQFRQVRHSSKGQDENKQKWKQYKQNRRKFKKTKQNIQIQQKSVQESSQSVKDESSQKVAVGHDEDEVSQSSSFSKFSISSGRQNGKIFGLRK